MKIFATGASGFIGRAFCRAAVERGHQVLGLSRQPAAALPAGVELAQGSLEDTPWAQVAEFAPEVVLHLAWVATPRTYLTSPENAVWLEHSKTWLQRVHAMGRPHIAGVGTCIEYAASHLPLQEADARPSLPSPYAQAKAALFQWLQEGGLGAAASWSWFRVFYAFGPGEHHDRLGSTLIARLHAGDSLELRTPESVKDYVYIDDVAEGLLLALETRLTGAVNVGTGSGIDVESLARTLARLLHADPGLVRRAETLADDPNPVMIADSTRLRSLGWAPRVNLEEGLQRLIDSLPPETYQKG